MITQNEFEAMIEECLRLLKQKYLIDSNSNEEKIKLSKLVMEDKDLERHTIEVTYKKIAYKEEQEVPIFEKIANIYGFDLILSKTVKATDEEYERKAAESVAKYISDILKEKMNAK